MDVNSISQALETGGGQVGKGRDKEYLNGLQDIQGEKGSLSSGERLRLKTRIWESEYSRMAEAPRVEHILGRWRKRSL